MIEWVTMTPQDRLLILSCSQRKRHQAGLMSAIERYDGPAFRVLRRYLQIKTIANEHEQAGPDVYILSAEFGLIPADQPIPDYDRQMTQGRAKELKPIVLDSLRCLLDRECPYREIFIHLGKEYQLALAGWERWIPQGVIVHTADGSIGAKQGRLFDWLHGSAPPVPVTEKRSEAKLLGMEIELTPQEVLEVARQALHHDGQAAARFHTWFVQVDDQRVAPKWIVSKLTGLPVSAFVTGQARRLLTQLGVEVSRA